MQVVGDVGQDLPHTPSGEHLNFKGARGAALRLKVCSFLGEKRGPSQLMSEFHGCDGLALAKRHAQLRGDGDGHGCFALEAQHAFKGS